jgi:hypothetical protein
MSRPGRDRIDLLIDLRSALRESGQDGAAEVVDREIAESLAGHENDPR